LLNTPENINSILMAEIRTGDAENLSKQAQTGNIYFIKVLK